MKLLGVLRKKDIYIKLFVSYAFILLIPLVFTWMLYLHTTRLLTDNAEKRNMSMLEQTREIMDGHISEVEILLTQMANNKKVLQLMHSDNRSREEILLTYRNLINELSTISYSGDFIAGYYIWFCKEGYMVSPSGRLSPEEYFKLHHEGGQFDYEKWVERLEGGPPYLGYYCSYPIKFDGVWKEVLDFSLSFPIGTRRSNLGSIHIQLQQDRVKQLLERTLDAKESYAYVITKEGNIVTSLGIEGAVSPKIKEIYEKNESGYYILKLDGRKEMVSYTKSPKNGWIYVVVQPLEIVLKEAQRLRNLFWLLLLLCLVAGGGLAAVMVYWTTFPIRKMLTFLRRYQGETEAESWNDFENTIIRIINENAFIRKEVEQHRPIVKSTFLTKLIRGKFSGEEEVESNMQELGISIFGNRYTVLLIYISGYHRLVSRNILTELETTKAVVRKIASVIEVLEGALDVDTDETILAYIVPFRHTEDGHCIAQLREAVNDLQKMVINSNLNLNLMFFWGNSVESIFCIDRAYTQAKRKLEHFIMSGEVWDNIQKVQESGKDGRYVYAMETEFKLIHLCKEGKNREIWELLNMVKEDNFGKNQLEYSAMVLLRDEMKGTVYKLCGIIPMKAAVRDQLDHDLKALNSCDFEAVKEMYLLLCSQVNEKRSCQENKLMQHIVKSIEKNYTNPDFYLVTLAAEFNLNESYLSVFIKSRIGENFTIYIQGLRLEKSCLLLRETDETIDTISAMCGYSSGHVFRRAFKRHYGINPITFRENMKNFK